MTKVRAWEYHGPEPIRRNNVFEEGQLLISARIKINKNPAIMNLKE